MSDIAWMGLFPSPYAIHGIRVGNGPWVTTCPLHGEHMGKRDAVRVGDQWNYTVVDFDCIPCRRNAEELGLPMAIW